MNVLFLDQYSDLGGAQHCLLDLLPAVRRAGWTPIAAVPSGGPLVSRLRAERVEVYSIRVGSYSSGRKSIGDSLRFLAGTRELMTAIEELAARTRADLLYVNGPRLLPSAAWAARRPTLLFHNHNHLTQASAAWVAARALLVADATVVSCCRFAASPLRRHLGAKELHIVDNGVVGPEMTLARSRSQSGPRIGVIGRISAEKGQAEFLTAARILTRRLPNCRFVICGDALFNDLKAQHYRQALENLATELPVEFLGWCDDVYQVMAQLDLLVVPSVLEPGAPRTILQAYACGLAVVAFATGGIPEIVEDGETGFLVRKITAQALADRIYRLLAIEPEKLRAAAARGRVLWSKRFTIERYQQQMIEVMRLAAGHLPAAASRPKSATRSASRAAHG